MDLIIAIDTADPLRIANKLYNLTEAAAQYHARIMQLPPIPRAQALGRLVQAMNTLRLQIQAGQQFDIVFRSNDANGQLQRIFTCTVNTAGRLFGDPLHSPYWDGMLANNLFP